MLILFVAVLALLSYGLIRLRQQRSMFKDLPCPPHHAIWGHFLIMREAASTLPSDATPQLFAHIIRQRYNLGDFFYIDLWPLAQPQLVIAHPDYANQATQKMNLPKEGNFMRKWTAHILGSDSMVTSNGHEWMVSRKAFVPGFQPRKLLYHIPGIVDDAKEFCDVLKSKAMTGEVFRMEDMCARTVFNISTRVLLQLKCNAQLEDDEFLTLFRKQASFAPSDFWSRYLYDINPSRNYQKWRHGRALDRYVGRIVDNRAALEPEVDEKGKNLSYHAIDDAIAVSRQRKGTNDHTKPLDKEARNMLITSVKTLIFAGHDTSATTLSYTFAALSKHPEVLQRVRAEHDELFGKDTAAVPRILQQDPNLINNLHYTLAVIKEALRLWPPTGISFRCGVPGQKLTTPDGKTYPTYPFAVAVNNCATMSREDLFKEAEQFYPERHLVTDPADPYFVPKDAWRPFEKGPRACLGQTLAMFQMKAMLVMTLRDLDMEMVYDNGKFMYQVLNIAAKPSYGLPTRVRTRVNN